MNNKDMFDAATKSVSSLNMLMLLKVCLDGRPMAAKDSRSNTAVRVNLAITRACVLHPVPSDTAHTNDRRRKVRGDCTKCWIREVRQKIHHGSHLPPK